MREQMERPYSIHGRKHRCHLLEDWMLQLVEGVQDDRGGHGNSLSLAVAVIEHDILRVRRPNEAGEILQPHVLHARYPIDRRVEISICDVALLCYICICNQLRKKERVQIDGFVVVQGTTCTFERYEASFKKMLEVEIAHEAASACGAENDLGDVELLGSVEGEAHGYIGDDACHRRRIIVEIPEEVTEGGEGGFLDRIAQRSDVLGGVFVGGRQAVGDGLEAEVWEGAERGEGLRPEQASVVEVGVDEGNVVAMGIEELG